MGREKQDDFPEYRDREELLPFRYAIPNISEHWMIWNKKGRRGKSGGGKFTHLPLLTMIHRCLSEF